MRKGSVVFPLRLTDTLSDSDGNPSETLSVTPGRITPVLDVGRLFSRLTPSPLEPMPDRVPVTIREGDAIDVEQIRTVLRQRLGVKVSRRQVTAWNNNQSSLVLVALRNFRHIVGLCISDHVEDFNEIKHLWFDERYWPERDLQPQPLVYLAELACHEVPERPTRVNVPRDCTAAHDILRSAGYKFVPGHAADDDPIVVLEVEPVSHRPGRT